MTLTIAAGSAAPDFTLAGSDGQEHRFSDVLKDSRVLLVFYPGNNTPG
jgi:peroxiredoxin Q/BCP